MSRSRALVVAGVLTAGLVLATTATACSLPTGGGGPTDEVPPLVADDSTVDTTTATHTAEPAGAPETAPATVTTVPPDSDGTADPGPGATPGEEVDLSELDPLLDELDRELADMDAVLELDEGDVAG